MESNASSTADSKENVKISCIKDKMNNSHDEIIAMISHELRTPLATILMWIQMIRRGLVSDNKKELGLQTIEDSAIALKQIVDDLNDISKIVSGKLHLNFEIIDINKIINSVVESVTLATATRNLHIETFLDSNVQTIHADPVRLKQILWNLLNNAIKFSSQNGLIEIHLKKLENSIELRIKDYGKGINPIFLSKIFERFTQIDCAINRKLDGFGLGLSIVKDLIKLHNGNIWAESAGEGTGTTFIINLPIKNTKNIQ